MTTPTKLKPATNKKEFSYRDWCKGFPTATIFGKYYEMKSMPYWQQDILYCINHFVKCAVEGQSFCVQFNLPKSQFDMAFCAWLDCRREKICIGDRLNDADWVAANDLVEMDIVEEKFENSFTLYYHNHEGEVVGELVFRQALTVSVQRKLNKIREARKMQKATA